MISSLDPTHETEQTIRGGEGVVNAEVMLDLPTEPTVFVDVDYHYQDTPHGLEVWVKIPALEHFVARPFDIEGDLREAISLELRGQQIYRFIFYNQ